MKNYISEWWRWIRRNDWELVELISTDYAGWMPTQFRPYFIEVWKDKRSKKEKVVYCQ